MPVATGRTTGKLSGGMWVEASSEPGDLLEPIPPPGLIKESRIKYIALGCQDLGQNIPPGGCVCHIDGSFEKQRIVLKERNLARC